MSNTLFIEKAFIAGKFITSASTFTIINPSTQQAIGSLPDLSAADCNKAIKSADKAWHTWKNTSVSDRSMLLRRLFDLVNQHKEELAEIMTLESGKPLTESLGEVVYGGSFIEWFAEEGKRMYGENIPQIQNHVRMTTIKQGVGVVAAITPWNFPLAMITRKVAPALAAGCTVVLKPASQTPFTALALAKLIESAGFPKGVFHVVTSTNSADIGKELATNPLVRKISFTGSTPVGMTLMQQAASTIKRISFELGGNAPFIVFDDANLDKAVEGAIAGKFRNAGQTCVSINRFYVHETIYDNFSKKLATAVAALKVGDGLQKGVQVGPLINSKGIEKVEHHVQDAIAKGAKVLTGGNRIKGNFFAPTVLTEVSDDVLIASEETFGPICALFKFSTEDEVLKRANNTPFGLAAYFFSENIHRCQRIAENLEAGMVGVNAGLISNAAAPFGGIKQSGIGREGSKYGLDEYTELKYICYGL